MGTVQESLCEGEIEWTLAVDGRRGLEWGTDENRRDRWELDGGREYWE